MTSDAFIQGVRLLEGALQGDFLPKFLLFLEGRLKDIPDNTWGDVIDYLMRSTKKPRELTLNDFLRAWTEVRVQAEQRQKLERSREFVPLEAGDAKPLSIIFKEASLRVGDERLASAIRSMADGLELHEKARDGTITQEDRVDLLRKKYPERYQEALERQRAGGETCSSPPGPSGPLASPEELPEY